MITALPWKGRLTTVPVHLHSPKCVHDLLHGWGGPKYRNLTSAKLANVLRLIKEIKFSLINAVSAKYHFIL